MRSSCVRTYGAYTELGSIAEAMSGGDSLSCGGRKRSQGISRQSGGQPRSLLHAKMAHYLNLNGMFLRERKGYNDA